MTTPETKLADFERYHSIHRAFVHAAYLAINELTTADEPTHPASVLATAHSLDELRQMRPIPVPRIAGEVIANTVLTIATDRRLTPDPEPAETVRERIGRSFTFLTHKGYMERVPGRTKAEGRSGKRQLYSYEATDSGLAWLEDYRRSAA